ncbi:MAG: WecB/TagA/CpsF family glycosyltransferase [Desulfuromonadaceae bacterium]
MNTRNVVSLDLSIGPYREFVDRIMALGKERVSSYVCVANVHMTIEAWRHADFASVVNGADLVTPDGMPLVKSLKLLHGIRQDRVAGMDLFPDLIAAAEKQGLSVFFYGSTEEVLERLLERVRCEHPALAIAGSYSPPFRPLSEEEDQTIVAGINASGAHLVMVALGCPKQEQWMAAHRGQIHAVMLGVGGAFPVYAGMQSRAPEWMQQYSLEWLYRLGQEPRRLFKRYLVTNSLFVALLVRNLAQKELTRIKSALLRRYSR